MTPSARIQATLEILGRLETSPIPMDLTIGDYMRSRRYIGSKDRADIVERVYSIMRHHARLGWAIEKAGAAPSALLRLIAHLKMVEHHANPPSLFGEAKFSLPALDDETINVLRALPSDFSGAPDVVLAECPDLYAASLKKYFGDSFVEEMTALTHGATLDLRVNTVQADRDTVQASLKNDNIDTTPTPYSPWGLRVDGKVFLSQSKAFRAGQIEIQDEGSQLIALACNAQPGIQMLDYCAGGGGKTLALAAAMKIKGRIVAMDLEANRLAKARERFRRAKVSDIIEARPLSDEKNRKWLRRQKQSFDSVLVDVPCSGTGTWRRNPDMRWRTYGPSLEELLPVQQDILEKVAGTVKPGGRLVYATCSLLPEENEDQVTAFLAKHPEFTLAPLADIWPDGAKIPCDGHYMRLTPRRHNTDGFFAAVMIRAAEPESGPEST